MNILKVLSICIAQENAINDDDKRVLMTKIETEKEIKDE